MNSKTEAFGFHIWRGQVFCSTRWTALTHPFKKKYHLFILQLFFNQFASFVSGLRLFQSIKAAKNMSVFTFPCLFIFPLFSVFVSQMVLLYRPAMSFSPYFSSGRSFRMEQSNQLTQSFRNVNTHELLHFPSPPYCMSQGIK